MKSAVTNCDASGHHEVGREYPAAPLVGVGALIVQDGRIVLIRRGHPPARGEWSIPGGLVKLGEALSEAVVREALEETGLGVEPVRLVELLDRIFRDDQGSVRFHYVLADYLCRVRDGELSPSSDAMEAMWATPGDLELLGVAQVTRRVILKAFQEP